MPIALQCKDCDSSFHVKDDVAGKTIRCPRCKEATIRVPKLTPVNKSLSNVSAGSSSQWRFKGLDGEVYGPVEKEELDRWFAEGRINEQTQILAPGQEQWQWATTFYPSLSANNNASHYGQQASSYQQTGYTQSNYQPVASNPYGGQYAYGQQRPTYSRTQQMSHRSKITAGILGLLLGGLGVHRFYLGFVGIGFLQLILCFVTCGASGIWGFIEGILLLTGSMDMDADGRRLLD